MMPCVENIGEKIIILYTGCPRKNDTQLSGAIIQKVLNLQKNS